MSVTEIKNGYDNIQKEYRLRYLSGGNLVHRTNKYDLTVEKYSNISAPTTSAEFLSISADFSGTSVDIPRNSADPLSTSADSLDPLAGAFKRERIEKDEVDRCCQNLMLATQMFFNTILKDNYNINNRFISIINRMNDAEMERILTKDRITEIIQNIENYVENAIQNEKT